MIRLAAAAERHHMTLVVDTFGAFLADPYSYRGPSLASSNAEESARAESWIETWIKIAAEFHIPLITFGSGMRALGTGKSHDSEESMLNQLADRINRLCACSAENGVQLALRPASGEVVATIAQFERLCQWLDQPDTLFLAADVAEMLQEGEFPVADRLARNISRLACVYLCERESDRSRDQVPENCEIDLGRIATSLMKLRYANFAIARVDGHSEKGLVLAQDALQWFHEDS